MSDSEARTWTWGNAKQDGQATRGWWVGPYVQPPDSVRADAHVEIKWGVHAADEELGSWADGDDSTTMTVLVHGGPFCLDLPGNEQVVLVRPGDYVLWPPGTAHSWEALGVSTMLTVRWRAPSGKG